MKTCILAIQRYEKIKDLYEWIDYHIDLGFDHIFLMDNNDEKDALEISDEHVTIIPYYGQRNDETDWIWQRIAYCDGIDFIKQFDYDWISIFDIDEFISLKKHANIQEFITEECINKGLNNIELLWQLYNDNNIIYHKYSFDGHILDTYKCYFSPDVNFANTIYQFKNMKCFTKFIGRITPELYYKESAHYPAKELYDKGIYTWNVCDTEIAVLKHYKYKSLEDFISLKCKQRQYATAVHGYAWKYTRTYFEDNSISVNKLLAFAMLAFKYDLQISEWDLEYLKQLFKRHTKKDDNIYLIDFENYTQEKIEYQNFNVLQLTEFNLHIDVCPYVRFMYDHKLYDICKEFFAVFLLYYFGGIYINDLKYDYLMKYYNNNEYMMFIHNNVISSDIIMSKSLFNKVFLDIINYCKTFSYNDLEELYNKDKDNFVNLFSLNSLINYVVEKNNITINNTVI